MRGMSDLDPLCLREIFKNLTPLDLCAIRHCSKRLRYFVEDHFHSLYFIREQLLDLTAESNGNVSKILKHFGKFCRHLKVYQKTKEPNLMLDVIVTNCGKILKGLSLNSLHLYEMDMVKFEGVFDNLEFLELIDCRGDQQCIEFEYPNLMTLRIISSINKFGLGYSETTEILKKFFMKKRSIKALTSRRENGNLLPLIALNAPDIEELDISIDRHTRNVMSVAQLRNLKLLQINIPVYERLIISLLRELSVNTELEILGISRIYSYYTEEFWDALSNLTHLKQIRFNGAHITTGDNSSLQNLVRKLSKLESFMFVNCFGLKHRYFLEIVCKSDKLRKVYVWENIIRSNSSQNIKQLIKDFVGENRNSCFVSGNPLCIYLENKLFNSVKILLTQDNLKSIEKYGNIKIFQAKREDFSSFPPDVWTDY